MTKTYLRSSVLVLLSALPYWSLQCSLKSANITEDVDLNCSVSKPNVQNTTWFCREVIKIPVENCFCSKSLEVCAYENNVFIPRTVTQSCVYHNISHEKCSCKHTSIICKLQRFIALERRYKVSYAVITILAMVVGVVGNSLVLLVTFHQRGDLSKGKVVIALLAITDAVSSLLNFLVTIPHVLTDEGAFGVPLCKVLFTGMMACSWLSSGFIFIIGLERYFGILHPLRRDLYNNKIMKICVALNVILALGAGVPMVITTDVKGGVCHNYGGRSIVLPYHWFLMVVFMILPMFSVTFFYFRIIFSLHQRTQQSATLSGEEGRVKQAKENRRRVKILLPIVGAFIICVLPMSAIELFLAYYKEDGLVLRIRRSFLLKLVVIQNICFPLHACVNPIIYTFVDRDFRKNLLNSLCLRPAKEGNNKRPTRPVTIATSV